MRLTNDTAVNWELVELEKVLRVCGGFDKRARVHCGDVGAMAKQREMSSLKNGGLQTMSNVTWRT
jgi:hypothetical protein